VLTIVVSNQKGGVGKTTTVANLGAALAARGCDVCLIDLDPQSHLTLHFNIEPDPPDVSIYDVLSGTARLVDARIAVQQNLSVVPAVIDLAAAEVELAATVGREQILRDALLAEPLGHQLVMIDCPPSLGLLTLNALAAADELFIPLQPHFLALQGLGKLLETVRLVQRRINPALRVAGVVLCMYETATRLAAEVVDDLRGFFDAARGSDCPWGATRIFRTVIRRNIKLAECPSHGETIFQYDPSSRGALDYGEMADEFVRYYPDLFPPKARAPAAPRPPVSASYNPAQAPPIAAWKPVRRPPLYNPAQAPPIVAPRPVRRPPLYNPAQAPPVAARRPAASAPCYNPAQPPAVVVPAAWRAAPGPRPVSAGAVPERSLS